VLVSRVLTKSIDKSGVSRRYRLQPPSPAACLPINRAEDGALSDFVRDVLGQAIRLTPPCAYGIMPPTDVDGNEYARRGTSANAGWWKPHVIAVRKILPESATKRKMLISMSVR